GYGTDFKEKPTRAPIANEAEKSSKAGILNTPGTIAMARTSEPNSATAQFFINVGDNKFLNFRDPSPAGIGYTAFGKVIEGMEVVEKIAKTTTAAGGPFPRDVPIERVVIKSATVVGAP
ncbi:MAG TPA: peptidylprolyl isomerase, partial [Actinomycetota bacterium]|nr:peptidylprolyl isomerase [Actinomycetota bacterium]